MATLPPWLNVQPSQFAAAAESGARLGQADRAQAMSFMQQQQSNQLAQQSQQFQAQKLAMDQRQFQASQQASMMQLAMAKQESDRRHQLAITQLSVQAEIRKQAIQAQAQGAALKFQQQQQYQQAVNGIMSSTPGISLEDAAMKASFSTGFSSPGLASMYRATKPAAEQEAVFDDQGKNVGIRVGGQIKMFPAEKAAKGFSDPYELNGHTVQRDLATGEVKILTKPEDPMQAMIKAKMGGGSAKVAPGSKGKLDRDKALEFYALANGDTYKSRQMAAEAGYIVNQ